MNIDEGDDASIRVATRHDGQDGEQQHVGKLVFLSLPTAGIRHFRSRPSNGENGDMATSEWVACPGVRHSPIRESPFLSAASVRSASVLQHGLSSPHQPALNSLDPPPVRGDAAENRTATAPSSIMPLRYGSSYLLGYATATLRLAQAAEETNVLCPNHRLLVHYDYSSDWTLMKKRPAIGPFLRRG